MPGSAFPLPVGRGRCTQGQRMVGKETGGAGAQVGTQVGSRCTPTSLLDKDLCQPGEGILEALRYHLSPQPSGSDFRLFFPHLRQHCKPAVDLVFLGPVPHPPLQYPQRLGAATGIPFQGPTSTVTGLPPPNLPGGGAA